MPRLRDVAPLAFCFVLLSASGAGARSSTPPPGRTMAPGEQSCAGGFCHSGPGGAGVTVTLLESGAPFTQYAPGQLYTLTLGMGSTSLGRLRWGFEMTCLTSPGGTMAGDLATVDALTITQTSLGKEYISHFSAAPPPPDGTFDNNPGPVSWSISWQAPPVGPGATNVIFYVCGNAADSSSSASGDAILCTTFPVAVGLPPGDTDGDTLPDIAETGTCTSPTDADTDDDGLSDGAELALAVPTNPCECDTDGDSLPDGLELGVPAPLPDTDAAAGCFAPDRDTSSTTDPNNVDSDGDSPDGIDCLDGVEDANRNGRLDVPSLPPETDPNDGSDCPPVAFSELRIDDRITARSGGPPAPCGLLTTPSIGNWMLTPCNAPRFTGCDPAAAVPPTRIELLPPPVAGPDLVLTGEGDPDFEPGVLTYYEIDGCGLVLLLSRSGVDLLVDTQ